MDAQTSVRPATAHITYYIQQTMPNPKQKQLKQHQSSLKKHNTNPTTNRPKSTTKGDTDAAV